VSRRVTLLAALTALSMVLAVPAMAGQSELTTARHASAKYHDLSKALDGGFVPFSIDPAEEITCFDGPSGGMGVHYVRNIDAVVDAADPEALVYEVRPNGKLKLVALEYIVPAEFVDEADPPELFGQQFHPHSFLPVWILHAWVWSPNPSGMFADFNPSVGSCP